MASQDPLQQVFESSKKKFEDALKASKCDPKLYSELHNATTVDELWDVMENVQVDRKLLQHLTRISPFLERLRAYAKVVDVFVQVKPEILALIWGPIRLLLLWSSELEESFEAIIVTISRIGQILPHFETAQKIFQDNDRIKTFLGFFFEDILELWLISLKFFAKSSWNLFFDTMWAKSARQIKAVESNIEKHANLLKDEASFEHMRMVAESTAAALKNAEKDETIQQLQLFQALEASICPQLYDEKMDWLRSRVYKDTSNWLMKDDSFNRWIEAGDQSKRLIWLQGIPGAGKTFLAHAIASKTQASSDCRTIYVFASHSDSGITAISMIHSLIFQLASDSVDLQTVLIKVDKRKLKSDTSAAAKLLQDALELTGKTFMIIDGLDEIDAFELKKFVTLLLKIWAKCPELHVCICSRPEHDIRGLIEQKSDVIRVHDKNASSIQAYVGARYEEWMKESEFIEQAKTEIKGLFYTVANFAKGMFLYARIVIDNVKLLDDIEEIRLELKALPKDLHEAYQRLFLRINSLHPTARKKARKVLGWIGCAPVPMTIYEVEQALVVKSNSSDNLIVQRSLNVVELCGPILELIDEKPQFVHFTAKEYIFNSQVKDHLNVAESTLDLLKVCIMYLSADIFEEDLLDGAVNKYFRDGKYRLQAFAVSYWQNLVQRSIELPTKRSTLEELATVIETFASIRYNPDFVNSPEEKCDPKFNILRPWLETHKFLIQCQNFQTHPIRPAWKVTDTQTWVNFDPLTLSRAYVRTEREHKRFLNLAHSSGEDKSLKTLLESHYGKRLYRCSYVACPLRRYGFAELGECQEHEKHHQRPYKCSIISCQFSKVGFISSIERHEHWEEHHKEVDQATEETGPLPEQDELYPLLFELVEAESITELQRIWPRCRDDLLCKVCEQILIAACRKGSLTMMRILLDFDFKSIWELLRSHRSPDRNFFTKNESLQPVIEAAVQSGHIELIKWILEQMIDWAKNLLLSYQAVVAAVMKSPSLEVVQIWKETVFNADPDMLPEICKNLMDGDVLRAARRFPLHEAELLAVVERFFAMGMIGKLSLNSHLRLVATTSCSVELAKGFISLGAEIESDIRYYSILHLAAKKTTRNAAELMKFLLLKGADPHAKYRSKTPSMEPGARKIKKWLDMTWEELVEWASNQREASSNETENEMDLD